MRCAPCHPAPGVYTFWDYQAGAWQKNNGIRIDHLLLSPQAADRLASAGIDKSPALGEAVRPRAGLGRARRKRQLLAALCRDDAARGRQEHLAVDRPFLFEHDLGERRGRAYL